MHHSHHIGHPKKFKEYLLEFFMLFLAVTLGFFAENIREHISEEHKSKELLQVVGKDLRSDLKQLKILQKSELNKMSICDSFRIILNQSPERINQDKYYHLVTELPLFMVFNSIDKSRIDAEAKGYFLKSENQELSNYITKYNMYLLQFKELEKLFVGLSQKYMYDIVPKIAEPDLFQTYWKSTNTPFVTSKIGFKPISSLDINNTKFLLSNTKGILTAQKSCIDSMLYYGDKSTSIIELKK